MSAPVQSWQIGDVSVRCVQEVVMPVPAEALITEVAATGIADALGWLQPRYLTGDHELLIAIQSMLIESDGQRIVVDTCFGDDKTLPYVGLPPMGKGFLDAVAAVGFERTQVDTVLCTHLHLDHIGWNTMRADDGEWVATFPNARYLFGAAELAHWQTHEADDVHLAESVLPILAAGLCDPVEMDHRVTAEVRLVPTPGHTPGHCSVLIESGGERAMVSGDMFHHPIQVVEHHWPSVPDDDPVAAVATRARILPTLAADNVLLIGTHFAPPAAGYVRRVGERWGWEPFGS